MQNNYSIDIAPLYCRNLSDWYWRHNIIIVNFTISANCTICFAFEIPFKTNCCGRIWKYSLVCIIKHFLTDSDKNSSVSFPFCYLNKCVHDFNANVCYALKKAYIMTDHKLVSNIK